jgi:2-methylisocitrate lyase-like PEP mutase family enzyme
MTSLTQSEKANRFRELHGREGVLLIPNPWDVGSARTLEGLGFEALATSSAAFAATLGRRDGKVTREELLLHVRQTVQATNVPVSADLEDGFADEPDKVAETIRLAAEAGAVGGSIEDSPHDKTKPPYDRAYARERVEAAVAAARTLPFAFTLTARTENFVRGSSDLADTIQRLVSFEEAGADVLFAPGLPDLGAVREVCAAVHKPVNFMVGIKGKSFSVAELARAGVKRISFAASLYRSAMRGLFNAALEIKGKGTFAYLDEIVTAAELNAFLE